MSSKVVIMLGPPGAGKGTQAGRISAALGLPHVSTGDLFRANLSQETELGKQAKGYMEKGELVPDQLVIDMLFDRVAEPDCVEGYLLDGFPRTVPQAEALEARLDDVELTVLCLLVDDEVLVERLAGRGRDDDQPAVVRQRLAVYHEQTSPLIAYYTERGLLKSVDGAGTPDEVFEALERHLGGER